MTTSESKTQLKVTPSVAKVLYAIMGLSVYDKKRGLYHALCSCTSSDDLNVVFGHVVKAWSDNGKVFPPTLFDAYHYNPARKNHHNVIFICIICVMMTCEDIWTAFEAIEPAWHVYMSDAHRLIDMAALGKNAKGGAPTHAGDFLCNDVIEWGHVVRWEFLKH